MILDLDFLNYPCDFCDNNYKFSVYRKINGIKNSIRNLIRFDILTDLHNEMLIRNNGMFRY